MIPITWNSRADRTKLDFQKMEQRSFLQGMGGELAQRDRHFRIMQVVFV